ncbi:hypothetical protein SMC26_22655 [Actinomadura fulvescens]|uniref:hypothetical protein n=1 Tax=Actinomadura fulvescens TaxID=46160 RepID=UPI0031DE27A5
MDELLAVDGTGANALTAIPPTGWFSNVPERPRPTGVGVRHLHVVAVQRGVDRRQPGDLLDQPGRSAQPFVAAGLLEQAGNRRRGWPRWWSATR